MFTLPKKCGLLIESRLDEASFRASMEVVGLYVRGWTVSDLPLGDAETFWGYAVKMGRGLLPMTARRMADSMWCRLQDKGDWPEYAGDHKKITEGIRIRAHHDQGLILIERIWIEE